MNVDNTWYGPAFYEIKVKGRLGSQWADWFEGLVVTYQNGVTTLAGDVEDQAALHGLLNRIRDLGLQLVSLNRTNRKNKGT